ncbi:MAG: HEAT repeat domain-containing protein [Planctomycetota bacterium]|nr:HEAT repeat domain-containing protein [Planctomycetota bacterium]
MTAAALVLLLFAPDSERMLLGQSPFFRKEAVERAVRDGDRGLLVRAAHSEHWDARALAAEALGHDTPPDLLDDRVAVVRAAALRALGTRAPKSKAIALLTDPDDAVREAAAWALLGRRAGHHLGKLRKDDAVSVRMAVLAAVGDFPRLKRLATRRDPAVAVPALIALGRAGGSGEGSFLISRFSRAVESRRKEKTLLFYEAEPSVQLPLARAVADLGRRKVRVRGKSVAALLRKISERTDLGGSAGVLLAEAAAGSGDAELARRILDAQLRARRTSTRPDAFFAPALSAILHSFAREPWPELAPMLLPFLERRDVKKGVPDLAGPFVRVGVVRALQGDSALPALRDPHPAVRAAACLRVRRVEALANMVTDPDTNVLVNCARSLGRCGGDKAGAAVTAMLDYADARVRRAALGALVRLETPNRIQRLYEVATRDPDARVRETAAAVLAFLEQPKVLEFALQDLAHEDVEVRRQTIALVHRLTTARNGYDPKKPGDGLARWKNWLEHKGGKLRESDAFRYHVEDLRERGLDLVLVLDATGSMTPVLQETKRTIERLVRSLRALVPNLRLRSVAFRDHRDVFLTAASPLTADPRLIEDFLASIPATGGGDLPEGVLAGLRTAIEGTPWRDKSRRVVLLFGDAPPHERELTLLKTIVTEFKGTVHAIDVTGYPYATGKSVRVSQFHDIARWGRGSAVRLTAEDDLLRMLLVLALGPKHRASVETLFGL